MGWTMTAGAAAKLGAVPFLLGLVWMGFAWFVDPDPDSGTRISRLIAALASETWGRWLMTAIGTYMMGVPVLAVVAGFRGMPALRLDEDGISAWSHHRVRRIPLGDVRSVGAVPGRWKFPGLVVVGARGRLLRVSAGYLGMTADEASDVVRTAIASRQVRGD